MMGFLFGLGLFLILLGAFNWHRGVEAHVSVVFAILIGLGTGVVGQVLDTWVNRLARKP